MNKSKSSPTFSKKFEFLSLIFIILFYFLVKYFVIKYIPIRDYFRDDIFIMSLIGKSMPLPWLPIQILDFGNLFLMYIAGKKLFSFRVGIIATLIYAISPWTLYISLAGSMYIALLFCLMISLLGLVLTYRDKNGYGVILSALGITFSILISLSAIFLIPIYFYILYKVKFTTILSTKQKLFFSVMASIFTLALLVLMGKNYIGFKDILNRDLNPFTNIGLTNSINDFRGLSEKAAYPIIGKFVENKITYFGRLIIFNFLSQFTPTTYFTPEAKLLKFSFSSPIFFGFIFLFFLGLKTTLIGVKKSFYLVLVPVSLILPSVFSVNSPDLTRLILVSPIFFYLISIGFLEAFNSKKKLIRILLYCSIVLVFVQTIVTISDISFREPSRYMASIKK